VALLVEAREEVLTLVASSTLVSYSTNLTRPGSTISPSLTVFQSRPWNLGSPPFVGGGLFSKSCSACCVSDGCRDARGEVGAPRICSAKLERCGLGVEPILSAGGIVRPMEDVELPRDSFLSSTADSPWSAIAKAGSCREMRGLWKAGCCEGAWVCSSCKR
jgi:hypothetical protein